jgi:hypothetical protein
LANSTGSRIGATMIPVVSRSTEVRAATWARVISGSK